MLFSIKKGGLPYDRNKLELKDASDKKYWKSLSSA